MMQKRYGTCLRGRDFQLQVVGKDREVDPISLPDSKSLTTLSHTPASI